MPGTASILTPREGIVQECITSHPVTCALTRGASGRITLLVAVTALLVDSSILKNKKVEEKLASKGVLLVFFREDNMELARLKSLSEFIGRVPFNSSVRILRLLSSSSEPSTALSF